MVQPERNSNGDYVKAEGCVCLELRMRRWVNDKIIYNALHEYLRVWFPASMLGSFRGTHHLWSPKA